MNRTDTDRRFAQRVFRDPSYLVAAGFGAGLLPGMPGTWGTLLAAVIWLLVLAGVPEWAYLLVVAASLLLGVLVSARVTGELGVEDHQGIVWDEIAGYWLTMGFLPAVTTPVWIWAAVGFGLFRLFDILKPWPIRAVERQVHGGLGVMLDDVLAGVFAGALLLLAAGVAERVFT